MPQGLQIWNAAGVSIFDTTTLAGIILGSVVSGTADGSFSDLKLANGTGFCVVVPGQFGIGVTPPAVYISGTTILWKFPPGGGDSSTIFYGTL